MFYTHSNSIARMKAVRITCWKGAFKKNQVHSITNHNQLEGGQSYEKVFSIMPMCNSLIIYEEHSSGY